ncbi:MAG: M14 family metallocarboxypeptidase [Planctomycetota bacterium]|nr:M14 family metallocarboxypeptidase [Planctomycetota bacterium]
MQDQCKALPRKGGGVVISDLARRQGGYDSIRVELGARGGVHWQGGLDELGESGGPGVFARRSRIVCSSPMLVRLLASALIACQGGLASARVHTPPTPQDVAPSGQASVQSDGQTSGSASVRAEIHAQSHAHGADHHLDALGGSIDGVRMVRVSLSTFEQRDQVEQLASLASCRGGLGEVDYLVPPTNFEAFRALCDRLGMRWRVQIDDVGALVRAQRQEIARRALRAGVQRGVSWFENYHPLEEINSYLAQLATNHPELAWPVQSIGNSLQGRAINALRFSGPDRPGNPRNLRPQFVFNGGQHAREWVSPASVVFLADQFLERYASDARIRAIMDQAEFIIVPVVNPDGYVYSWTPEGRLWRKNRRTNQGGSIGVDLNRNWGFQWGLNSGSSGSGSSDTFRGPSAFSEPETRVLRDFIIAQPRVRAHIDFHSYSQLILSPWSYAASTPPDNAIFTELNPRMASAIFAAEGERYRFGATGQILYLASGTASDWTFGARGITAWGWELRDTGQAGFLLPPDQILPTGRETLAAVLAMAERLAPAFTFAFPDGIPSTALPNVTQNFRVQVTSNSATLDPSSPRMQLRDRRGGSYQEFPLTSLGGGVYTATIGPATCGTDLEFYFEASATNSRVGRHPPLGEEAPLLRRTRSGTFVVFADDFEIDRGWSYQSAGDGALSGRWARCQPEGTTAQADADVSPTGLLAAITGCSAGSSPGDNDLDAGASGGSTTLTSPRLNALPPSVFLPGDVTLSYSRWFFTDAPESEDRLRIEASGDDGATWTVVEELSSGGRVWTSRTIRVAEFVPLTESFRLRVTAVDGGADSLVEAGIDEVRLTAQGCPCRADFNRDGDADFFDYLDFALALAEESRLADVNLDGQSDFFDYLDFAAAYDVGCP